MGRFTALSKPDGGVRGIVAGCRNLTQANQCLCTFCPFLHGIARESVPVLFLLIRISMAAANAVTLWVKRSNPLTLRELGEPAQESVLGHLATPGRLDKEHPLE